MIIFYEVANLGTVISKMTVSCNKVSVIIPTYNRGHLLERCIGSVISQGYSNVELLIIDDGSEDETEKKVEELKKQYPAIRYCHNVRSKGPSGARNTGILKSNGNYIAFLDSDDTWNSGHLTSGVQILENNPDIDVLFSNFQVVEANTEQPVGFFFDDKKILLELNHSRMGNVRVLRDNLFLALIRENFFHFGGAILRRSAVDDIMIDEDISYAEDRDFAIRLFKQQNAVFAYRNDPAFQLYRHDQSLVQLNDIDTTVKILHAHLKIYRKYLKTLKLEKHEKKVLRGLLSKRLMSLSYCYRLKNMPGSAANSVLRSCRYGISFGKLKEIPKVIYIALKFDKNIKNQIG